ncbi:helix-turn-helix domain-containing protein [Nonomuraea jiangxiensis]|uniref:Helix-turn-helix domain-containing protein n=1 Tax=Nonomuraea jiangxiensis TaxID=633440 RepID=A0A1G9EV57_9ACTN|nr:helix-turn-helix domain-containing protein [Nonomuraea jiangxiensis]SDK79918.1 hypothetical protein SAMN05421869_11928 [Nonomuraea jiangxiensis]
MQDNTLRGRRERPVPPGPLQEFAQGLRELRADAGNPSYRAMERKAGYSASALSAAAAGDRLPSLGVTQAYAGACGGDQDEWSRRWHEAKAELDVACAVTMGGETDRGIGAPPSTGAAQRLPRRRVVRLSVSIAVLGLVGLVTAGAFGTDLPSWPVSATKGADTSAGGTRQEVPAAGLGSAVQSAQAAEARTSPVEPVFTAVAGPYCPRDTSRTVRMSGVPGQDGWREDEAPGWTGDGCGNGFLFSNLTYDPQSAERPQNTFQWRFTTGLRGRHQCFVEAYVVKARHAAQRVWYTVRDGFDDDARTVAEFTLDQGARQGAWIPTPFPVAVTSGMVMVEIRDNGLGNTTGDRSMAAGPVRLSCL